MRYEAAGYNQPTQTTDNAIQAAPAVAAGHSQPAKTQAKKKATQTQRQPRRSVAKVKASKTKPRKSSTKTSNFKASKIKASDLDWAGMAQQLLNVRTFIDLKQELAEVGNQLKKIDVTASMSPAAQKRLTELDRRYKQVIEGLARTQKTFDRDFDRVLRKLQASKKEATKRLNSIKKASKNIKKSFAK